MDDNALIEMMKKFEGYNPRAYPDHKQYSIGYGTKALSPNEVIDKAEAERRFRSELDTARGLVKNFAPNAPPGVRGALTSLTFNSGTKWQGAGLGNAVKAGDWSNAKNRLLQYTRASGQVLPGLVRRRQAEAALFGAPEGAFSQSTPQAVASASGDVPPVLQSGFGRESGPGAMPPASSPEPPGLMAQVKAAAAKPLFTTPEFMGGKSITGKGIMSGIGSMASMMGKDDEQTKARLRQNAQRANADALGQSEQAQVQALQSILARHKRGAFA